MECIFEQEISPFVLGDGLCGLDLVCGDRLLPSNHSNFPPINIITDLGQNILNPEYEATEKNLSSSQKESSDDTDILIGSNIDLISVVQNALPIVQHLLDNFSSKVNFEEQMNLAFGESYDVSKADALIGTWQNEHAGFLPQIKIVSESKINGANGAFAGETQTIYLAQEFVEDNVGNVGAIAPIILEEYAYYFDGEVNSFDTPMKGKFLSVLFWERS